eukprot:scaffold52991_cov10-Tisochrysis_lutea.AAC.1
MFRPITGQLFIAEVVSLARFAGTQLFAAHNTYNLAAIVAESASADLGTASYYGVALTKKSMCATLDGDTNQDLDDSLQTPITGLDNSLK